MKFASFRNLPLCHSFHRLCLTPVSNSYSISSESSPLAGVFCLQWDTLMPLSPFLFLLVFLGDLFLLVVDCLHCSILDLWVCRRALVWRICCLPNDSLGFFRANAEHARVVKEVIGIFERGTCQLLSPAKCSLLVNEEHGLWSRCLQMQHARIRKGIFQPIEERFVKRMVSLKERELSSASSGVQIRRRLLSNW